jgi:hypothetical protein
MMTRYIRCCANDACGTAAYGAGAARRGEIKLSTSADVPTTTTTTTTLATNNNK